MLANLIWSKSNRGEVLPSSQTFDGHGNADLGSHPQYTGWEIKRPNPTAYSLKGPNGYDVKPNAHNLPWLVPDRPLAFSNEDLFLQAVGLRAKSVKEGRNLTEIYETLKDLPREAVNRLIDQRNDMLQRANLPLEWKLAGLQTRKRGEKGYRFKTVYLFVILKTEWRLRPSPYPNDLIGATRGPAGAHRTARVYKFDEAPRGYYRTTYGEESGGAQRYKAGPSRSRDAPSVPIFSSTGSPSNRAMRNSSYSPPSSPEPYEQREDIQQQPTYLEQLKKKKYMSSAPPPTPGPSWESSYGSRPNPPTPESHPRQYIEIARSISRRSSPELHANMPYRNDRSPSPRLHQELPHMRPRSPSPARYPEETRSHRHSSYREHYQEVPHMHHRSQPEYYQERPQEYYQPRHQEYPNPPPPPPWIYHQLHIYPQVPTPELRQERDNPIPQVRQRQYEQVRGLRSRDPIRHDPAFVNLWKDRDRGLWEEVYLGLVSTPYDVELTVGQQNRVMDGLVSQWDEVVERLPEPSQRVQNNPVPRVPNPGPRVPNPVPKIIPPQPKVHKKKKQKTSISGQR
jgi:hypothetical protein